MSKGDTPRPTDKKKYAEGYERVFGKREVKVWTDAPKVVEGTECPHLRIRSNGDRGPGTVWCDDCGEEL